MTTAVTIANTAFIETLQTDLTTKAALERIQAQIVALAVDAGRGTIVRDGNGAIVSFAAT